MFYIIKYVVTSSAMYLRPAMRVFNAPQRRRYNTVLCVPLLLSSWLTALYEKYTHTHIPYPVVYRGGEGRTSKLLTKR